ncbi:hypothetical protein ACWPM1_04090 [Tsuneonella sp. HG249]
MFDPDAADVQNHRRWRRDRVDAGDVIGGLLVIGTIAAVASAASKASRNDPYRDRDYRYPGGDYRSDYRTRRYNSGWGDNHGLDRAVDLCVREVERNARLETVDSVNRTGAGWDVSGRLRTGGTFRCTIGDDGRIDDVDYGQGSAYRGVAEDQQWDDDRYSAARSAQDAAGEQISVYPGGPIESEALPESSEDDRYETAQAPDFPG